MEETDRTGDFAPWWKIVSSRDATPRASGSYAPAQRLPLTLDTAMLHSQPIDELQVKFSRDAGQTVQVCPSTGGLDSKQLLGNVYNEARLKPKYSRVIIQRPFIRAMAPQELLLNGGTCPEASIVAILSTKDPSHSLLNRPQSYYDHCDDCHWPPTASIGAGVARIAGMAPYTLLQATRASSAVIVSAIVVATS